MSDKLKELTNSDIEEMRKLHNAGKRHNWIAHNNDTICIKCRYIRVIV